MPLCSEYSGRVYKRGIENKKEVPSETQTDRKFVRVNAEAGEVLTSIITGGSEHNQEHLTAHSAYKIIAAPEMVSSAPRRAPYVRVDVAAAPPSAAGGAAPLAVGEELPDAGPVAESLPGSVAEVGEVAVGDEEPAGETVLLLRLEVPEARGVVVDVWLALDLPVDIRLRVELAGRTLELEDEGSSKRSTTILISVH